MSHLGFILPVLFYILHDAKVAVNDVTHKKKF